MKKNDYLLISDYFSDGLSLSLSLAKEFEDRIFLVSSEHITLVKKLVETYDLAEKISIFSTRPWEEGIYVINILNLNDISIAISKTIEKNTGVFIFTIIPELLMIHGLEKTYMFLHNTMVKIRAVNGATLALLNSFTATKREEKILQRLFANTIFLKREGGKRIVYFEYPADVREEISFEILKVDVTPLLESLEKV